MFQALTAVSGLDRQLRVQYETYGVMQNDFVPTIHSLFHLSVAIFRPVPVLSFGKQANLSPATLRVNLGCRSGQPTL
jgi:hypothetical protein